MLPSMNRQAIFVLSLIASVAAASAQDYPNKPIRIVTSAIGGGTDFAARLMAQGLAARMGQPVIVDNRPPALQGVIVPRSAPDGYNLLVGGETLWISTLLQKMPYDPITDFAPITTAMTSPNVLVVNPGLPVKSVRDLIELAKARKGDLDYGAGSIAGSAHLAGELFKSLAGVNMVRIPHKGTGDLLNSMLAGQVQLAFVTIPGAQGHIKSGKLRGVAVTSAKPTALLPGLPPVADTLPGYKFVGDVVLLAPAKTPSAIIARLNRETLQVINAPELKDKLLAAGFEVEGSTPQELSAWMKAEIVRWTKIIKDAGIAVN